MKNVESRSLSIAGALTLPAFELMALFYSPISQRLELGMSAFTVLAMAALTSSDKLTRRKLAPAAIAINLACFFFLLGLRIWRLHIPVEESVLGLQVMEAFVGILLFATGTMLLTTWDELKKWGYLNRQRIALAAAALFVLVLGQPEFLQAWLWKGLSRSVGRLCSWMFFIVGIPSGLFDWGMGIRAGTSLFTVEIRQPCSGVEGLTLFGVGYLCYQMVRQLKVSLFTHMQRVLLGMLMMHLLNSFRIFSLLLLGHWLTAKWGPSRATEQIVDIFHSNIGWLLDFGFLFVYFACIDRFWNKPPDEPKKPMSRLETQRATT